MPASRLTVGRRVLGDGERLGGERAGRLAVGVVEGDLGQDVERIGSAGEVALGADDGQPGLVGAAFAVDVALDAPGHRQDLQRLGRQRVEVERLGVHRRGLREGDTFLGLAGEDQRRAEEGASRGRGAPVAVPFGEVQRQPAVLQRLVVVAELVGEHRSGGQQASGLQTLLGHVVEHPQRHAAEPRRGGRPTTQHSRLAEQELDGDRAASRVERPVDGRLDVGGVVVETSQGECGVGAVELRLERLGAGGQVRGQQLAGPAEVGMRHQPLPRERAHGAEHDEAHLGPALHGPDEPGVDDRGDRLDGARDVRTDRLDGLDGEPPFEQRQPVTHQSRLGGEAVVAPARSRTSACGGGPVRCPSRSASRRCLAARR